MEYPVLRNLPDFDLGWVEKVLAFIDTENVSRLQISLEQYSQWYLWREYSYYKRSFLDIAIENGKSEAVRYMFFMCNPIILLRDGINHYYYPSRTYVENAAKNSDARMVSELITIRFPFNTILVFNQYPDVVKHAYQVAFEKQNKQFVSHMFEILLNLPLDVLEKYIDPAMEWTQWQGIGNVNFLVKSIYLSRTDIVRYIFNLYGQKYWPQLIRQTLDVDHTHILQHVAQTNIYLFIDLVSYGCNVKEFINNDYWKNHFSFVCQYAIQGDNEYIFSNIYSYADLAQLDLSKATGTIDELIRKCITPDKPSPLQIAVIEDDIRLIISLVRHGCDTSLYPTIFDFICEYAITIDDKEMFSEFIARATLSQDWLERATGDIEKLLNYRPQKRNNQLPTIKECLTHPQKQPRPKIEKFRYCMG